MFKKGIFIHPSLFSSFLCPTPSLLFPPSFYSFYDSLWIFRCSSLSKFLCYNINETKIINETNITLTDQRLKLNMHFWNWQNLQLPTLIQLRLLGQVLYWALKRWEPIKSYSFPRQLLKTLEQISVHLCTMWHEYSDHLLWTRDNENKYLWNTEREHLKPGSFYRVQGTYSTEQQAPAFRVIFQFSL